jgi:hypothetical protein
VPCSGARVDAVGVDGDLGSDDPQPLASRATSATEVAVALVEPRVRRPDMPYRCV